MPSVKNRVAVEYLIYFLTFVVTVGIVVYYYRQYLYHPIYQDDLGYFYHDPPLTWRKALNYCNPAWGWYFRPVFNNYVVGMTTLFNRQSVPVHAAGLVLTGITVWLLGVLGYRLRGLGTGILAAVLFVLAPHKDEAIWWPAASNALLAGCFYCATLLCWTIWRQTDKRRWHVLSLVSLVLTLCSKDDAISLPISLFFLDLALKRGLAFTDRIRLFVPVAVITAIYIVCDKIGYEHAVKTNPGAALFAFEPLTRLYILAHFDVRNFLSAYVDVQALQEYPPVLFFVGVGIAIWRLWNKPLLLALLSIALIASAPAPLGTGMHSASERFSFLPELLIALFMSSAFIELATSPSLINKYVASALVGSFVVTKINFSIADPLVIWCELFLLCTVTAVLWRAKVVAGVLPALVLSVSVLSQLDMFLAVVNYPMIKVALLLVTGAAITVRYRMWPGAMILALLCDEAECSQPIFVVCAVAASVIARRRVLHEPASPAVAGQPEPSQMAG